MTVNPRFRNDLQQIWAKPRVPEVVVTLVLLVAIVSLNRSMTDWTRNRAAQWVKTFDTELNTHETVEDRFVPSVAIADPERNRIEAQFQQIRSRAKHHLEVMIEFYSWYYAAIITASLAATVAAMALFWITKNGWANAPPMAITVFVLMTAAAVYYRAFPGMFQQEQNIAENKRLYLVYVALENEVQSYAVTGQNSESQKLSPADFIHYLDTEMARRNNIALGLDVTKIPDLKIKAQ